MDAAIEKKLRPFTEHGVIFDHVNSSGQAVGTCPFTNKALKFYVNVDKLLWDSKVTGQSGNLHQFFEAVFEKYRSAWESSKKARLGLAEDRGLPAAAFRPFEIGYRAEDKTYMLALRNQHGHIVNVKRYQPESKRKHKFVGTSGCPAMLFNVNELTQRRKSARVYLCEGEWDAIALTYLFKKAKVSGVVLAVPGANTFKKEWADLFLRRDVVMLYDNDEAGIQGEYRAYQSFKSLAKSVEFTHWEAGLPEGHDVRDWVTKGLKLGKASKCWEALLSFFQRRSRVDAAKQDASDEDEDVGITEDAELPEVKTYRAIDALFNEHFKLKTLEPVAVAYSAMLANALPGDPLWLFMIAPPGTMKTEILTAASLAPFIECKSDMTPATLVSGFNSKGGDPSLMPRLDGKVLVIKDFTTLLSQNPNSREEIFGQLRDAYDGSHEKQFGNGILRKYSSRFGIVAGVTPSIDMLSDNNVTLGERFLSYRVQPDTSAEFIEAMNLQAIYNEGREDDIRKALQATVGGYLQRRWFYSRKHLERYLSGSKEELEFSRRISTLATLVAGLRAASPKIKFEHDVQAHRPTRENTTRLSKQLVKLAKGLRLFWKRKHYDEAIWRVVRKVGLDSVRDNAARTLRILWDAQRPMATRDVGLVDQSLSYSTYERELKRLTLVGMVQRDGEGRGTRSAYQLTNETQRQLTAIFGKDEWT